MQFEGDLMEPSFLLGTFTALVDRILNLEKTKLQDKKDLFNEIVKPLFEELEPVASNYREIFLKAKQIMNDPSHGNLYEAMTLVAEKREDMILARIKVIEMANQITDNITDKEVLEFAYAVDHYFFGVRNDFRKTRTRMLLYDIAHRNKKAKKYLEEETSNPSQYLLADIEFHLSGLDKKWSEIIQAYERLKIHSVSPKKYIRKKLG